MFLGKNAVTRERESLNYILNTPNLVSSTGRFMEAAEMQRPMIFLVSAGSIIPSSQSLAVE